MDAGDAVSRLREVFSWSDRVLGAGAARLFRLLSLHAGPDVALPAVAALAGLTPEATRTLLTELTRGSLLIECSPGRYALHDLLRSYAGELAATHDRAHVRRAAIGRLLDHYLHTAHAADVLLNRKHALVVPLSARPGAHPGEFAEPRSALAWFTAESAALVAAVEQARTAGFGTHAWQLAAAVTTFLNRQGRWKVLASCHDHALAAALGEGDLTGVAVAHHGLGLADAGRHRVEDARAHHALALDLFGKLGDHTGQARSRQNLSWLAGA